MAHASSVAFACVVLACGATSSDPATRGPRDDAGADEASTKSDAAPVSAMPNDASTDARPDAEAKNAECKELCAGTSPMACTFARDGVVGATGTYAMRATTLAGCTGIASVVGDEEQRVIELDCTAAEVCVVDGAKRNCFPAEFTMNQFAYEIPVDKKRNTCALP